MDQWIKEFLLTGSRLQPHSPAKDNNPGWGCQLPRPVGGKDPCAIPQGDREGIPGWTRLVLYPSPNHSGIPKRLTATWDWRNNFDPAQLAFINFFLVSWKVPPQLVDKFCNLKIDIPWAVYQLWVRNDFESRRSSLWLRGWNCEYLADLQVVRIADFVGLQDTLHAYKILLSDCVQRIGNSWVWVLVGITANWFWVSGSPIWFNSLLGGTQRLFSTETTKTATKRRPIKTTPDKMIFPGVIILRTIQGILSWKNSIHKIFSSFS